MFLTLALGALSCHVRLAYLDGEKAVRALFHRRHGPYAGCVRNGSHLLGVTKKKELTVSIFLPLYPAQPTSEHNSRRTPDCSESIASELRTLALPFLDFGEEPMPCTRWPAEFYWLRKAVRGHVAIYPMSLQLYRSRT